MADILYVLKLAAMLIAVSASSTLRLELVSPSLDLPNVTIDNASKITVSGISSGACFSVQFHAAFSTLVGGSAIFSGMPYHCYQGNSTVLKPETWKDQCKTHPQKLDLKSLVDYTRSVADQGFIDPLENMANARVYLFRGSLDPGYHDGAVNNTQHWYEAFVGPNGSVVGDLNRIPASHGIPTIDTGDKGAKYPPTKCNESGEPFLRLCGFDGAGAALLQLYDDDLQPRAVQANISNLVRYHQRPYFNKSQPQYLSEFGYVYVPPQCAEGAGTTCRLHVNFHGCHMSADNIQLDYLSKAGFIEWADSNDLVILFPQSLGTSCWDKAGDTGADYAFKTGPEMAAVKRIVDAVLRRATLESEMELIV